MKELITELYDKSPAASDITSEQKQTILSVIQKIDQGELRVCEKQNGQWVTHEWIKKAILLYFKIQNNIVMGDSPMNYFDKLPVKKWTGNEGVRVVPPAVARFGSYIEKGAILMPSYVNIGAYVGAGSMVDTWATVGSCAQIGANVHLSGGVGIGGVLEPAQAQPVIIEDDCFIGSRCIVVEGVHLEAGVVLGAGVTITASTKIIDVTGSEPQIMKGRVPANSVVIPGSENKSFSAGTFGVPCALIIGKRQESTNKKTSLNQALRDYAVSV
ncbi:2,3,4,5-tetrahydropyridine-2,6-dicarboxylate N-succinyltransferase [Pseudobdellovibrio exovorus]|uniref:2,3,4,5-tetrahydropyridine-2-carboxylate N-succinyltransferase n=1 Tax=Pseudobdellovibrio exovorus JSS TaxID=1184267 RepID=M4V7Z3_9BACT|nr:2,3,4,5-tetrahydropyridine-2,6-dicarboxylate N-succinyltransferase [Pseudobdellovibrio exovorus]AGH95343.1 2,3,4,5-tetrahydropyridine-2-carboxylate N-succinyltransferase [Pseudobdellovibrio exovorus JSS]